MPRLARPRARFGPGQLRPRLQAFVRRRLQSEVLDQLLRRVLDRLIGVRLPRRSSVQLRLRHMQIQHDRLLEAGPNRSNSLLIDPGVLRFHFL